MRSDGKTVYNSSFRPIRETLPKDRADGDYGVTPRSVSYIPVVPRSPAAATLQTTPHEAEVLPERFRLAQSLGTALLLSPEETARFHSARSQSSQPKTD